MDGPTLVYGGKKQDRIDKALRIIQSRVQKNFTLEDLQKNPDVLWIQQEDGKKSIGIKQTRQVVAFLGQKPLNFSDKVVVIENAQTMTTEAQNSLLKILEEPPEKSCIVLLAKTQDGLLPTVQSRCKKILAQENKEMDSSEKIRSDSENKLYDLYSWEKISGANLEKKFQIAEELAKEETPEIVEVLESWIFDLRSLMVDQNTSNGQKIVSANAIKFITQKVSDLENTNVQTRLTLEVLMIEIS